jgi:hypothetical protein
MQIITKHQYTEALTICQQYRAQINAECAELEDTLIRTLIQDNLGRMSTRCFNMLERAIAKGYVTTSELTAARLMNISGVGAGTITEFQSLITK